MPIPGPSEVALAIEPTHGWGNNSGGKRGSVRCATSEACAQVNRRASAASGPSNAGGCSSSRVRSSYAAATAVSGHAAAAISRGSLTPPTESSTARAMSSVSWPATPGA